jgi:DnaJ-class molecular chaperone
MEELEVEVNPGTKDGDVISFERLDDVLVTIIQKPHPTFERSGSTLIVHKTITLGEALVGAKFPLKHLDGRTLLCSTEPNTVISPGTILTVPNEGFPKSGSPGHFGDLVIIFDVAFPNAHEIDLIALRAFCPLPLEEIPPAGDDVCYCEMMDASAVDFSHADDTMQSSGLDSD